MASKAQLEGNKRYLEKLDDIKIRVPKGHRDVYKDFAATQGKSLNAMVVDLLNAAMVSAGQVPPSPVKDEV